MVSKGHQLILYTVRDGIYLVEAVKWFERNAIPLTYVNNNPTQPDGTSIKIYADLCIDNANVGTPILYDENNHDYVNWAKLEASLRDRGAI